MSFADLRGESGLRAGDGRFEFLQVCRLQMAELVGVAFANGLVELPQHRQSVARQADLDNPAVLRQAFTLNQSHFGQFIQKPRNVGRT